jgi:hypothetical protein
MAWLKNRSVNIGGDVNESWCLSVVLGGGLKKGEGIRNGLLICAKQRVQQQLKLFLGRIAWNSDASASVFASVGCLKLDKHMGQVVRDLIESLGLLECTLLFLRWGRDHSSHDEKLKYNGGCSNEVVVVKSTVERSRSLDSWE